MIRFWWNFISLNWCSFLESSFGICINSLKVKCVWPSPYDPAPRAGTGFSLSHLLVAPTLLLMRQRAEKFWAKYWEWAQMVAVPMSCPRLGDLSARRLVGCIGAGPAICLPLAASVSVSCGCYGNSQLCFVGGPEKPGLPPPGSVGKPWSGAAGNEVASSAPRCTGISSGSSKMLLKHVK